jgi:hypothetical protein
VPILVARQSNLFFVAFSIVANAQEIMLETMVAA